MRANRLPYRAVPYLSLAKTYKVFNKNWNMQANFQYLHFPTYTCSVQCWRSVQLSDFGLSGAKSLSSPTPTHPRSTVGPLPTIPQRREPPGLHRLSPLRSALPDAPPDGRKKAPRLRGFLWWRRVLLLFRSGIRFFTPNRITRIAPEQYMDKPLRKRRVIGCRNWQCSNPSYSKNSGSSFRWFYLTGKMWRKFVHFLKKVLRKLKKMFISWAEYILKYQKRDIAKIPGCRERS